jgi:hypothetical protein
MSGRTTGFFFAALAMIALALWGAGCADDIGSPFDEIADAQAIPDAGDAGTKDARPDADTDAGSDTGVPATFDVIGAESTGNTAMTVTFDAPPDPAQAAVLGNYGVAGLVLSGTPSLAGNVVTLVTAAQAAQSYTVTVSGVTRASDGAPLTVASETFMGRATFDVSGAVATTAKTVQVTFDGPPNMTQATNAANYTVPGLTLSAPQLVGSVVTLTTSVQSAQMYTVTVAGVTRAGDGDPLVVSTADFDGRLPFEVTSAQSTSSVSMTVTFDMPPTAASATNLANYAVPGLVLSGTPVLSGSTVTITTSAQLAQTYTLTVSNVTRASDAEPLDMKSADFAGTPVLAPTVTNVVVASTNPNNGAIPYNTGTATLQITGTDFATVVCLTGVKLDDLDGVDAPVGTVPTTCTVDSDTQITATFPAGIRTNGTKGWNVLVTNTVGPNATSDVPFVPVAGLLVSEVYTGTVGATDHEYLEIYNPTANGIDTTAAGIGLKVHIRSSTGTTDTNKTLTLVTTGIIPTHGFLLVVSSASDAGDAWYAHRDYTFSAGLVGNGGVYLSLSATNTAKVIDKVGWGTQPAGGFEGTAALNAASNLSIERKPAGGAGHATDTDVNLNDFNLPSATITPLGSVDAAQP